MAANGSTAVRWTRLLLVYTPYCAAAAAEVARWKGRRRQRRRRRRREEEAGKHAGEDAEEEAAAARTGQATTRLHGLKRADKAVSGIADECSACLGLVRE